MMMADRIPSLFDASLNSLLHLKYSFCAKGSNVATQLYTPDGANKVKSYDDMMPVGEEGRLIAFSIKNGRYYFAKKEITITANLNESLTLTETTEANVQTEISSLNNY